MNPASRTQQIEHTRKRTYTKAWRWDGDLEEWFHNQLSSLTNPPERPVVHVCCGESNLGDIRIDVASDLGNVQADAFKLPFEDASIGTLVCDPPYWDDLNVRISHMKELARVHRPGGLLLYKADWLPFQGKWEREGTWIHEIRCGLPRDPDLLCRARRRDPS